MGEDNVDGDDATDVEIVWTIALSLDGDWVIGRPSVVVRNRVVVDGKIVLGVVGDVGVVTTMVVLVINFFNFRIIIESEMLVLVGVDRVDVDDDWVDDSVMYPAAARDTALAAVRTVLWTIFGK